MSRREAEAGVRKKVLGYCRNRPGIEIPAGTIFRGNLNPHLIVSQYFLGLYGIKPARRKDSEIHT